MRSRRWNTGSEQDIVFEEPRRSAVAVAKGMYPGNIEMRKNGPQNAVHDTVARLRIERIIVQPRTEPVEKVIAILARRTQIIRHSHVVQCDLARNYTFL